MKNKKIKQICNLKDCDKKPVIDVQIGNKKHDFCCQKGFEKSIKDFNDFIKNN